VNTSTNRGGLNGYAFSSIKGLVSKKYADGMLDLGHHYALQVTTTLYRSPLHFTTGYDSENQPSGSEGGFPPN